MDSRSSAKNSAEYYTLQSRILSRYEPVGNDRVYMLADHLGTIAAETDNRGTRIYRGWFSPYGGGAASFGSPGRFGWIGSYGYRDAAWTNGNHPSTNYLTSYVRARHYSRTQARWTTVDPLYPDESAYGYVGGFPQNRVDPMGLESVTVEINGFLHRYNGEWIKEPFPLGGEYRGDNRDWAQVGSSRISAKVEFSTCAFVASGSQDRGTSTRREAGVISSRRSSVSWTATNVSRSQFCPNPCLAGAVAGIAAYYPFPSPHLPAAPTTVYMDARMSASGKNQVTIDVDYYYSPYPDFELIISRKGKRSAIRKHKKTVSNWELIKRRTIHDSISITIPAAVDCCCTPTKECLGKSGCPCPR